MLLENDRSIQVYRNTHTGKGCHYDFLDITNSEEKNKH